MENRSSLASRGASRHSQNKAIRVSQDTKQQLQFRNEQLNNSIQGQSSQNVNMESSKFLKKKKSNNDIVVGDSRKSVNNGQTAKAVYSDSAQNYMISIVQNVYVGNVAQNTQGSVERKQVTKRKPGTNAGSRQVAQNLMFDNQQNNITTNSVNYKTQKPVDMVFNQRNSRILNQTHNTQKNSQLKCSTNQAAINHYMNEIQNTNISVSAHPASQSPNKKRRTKRAQVQQQASQMSGKTVGNNTTNKVSEISPSMGIPASGDDNIIDQDILNQIRAISRQERTNMENQTNNMDQQTQPTVEHKDVLSPFYQAKNQNNSKSYLKLYLDHLQKHVEQIERKSRTVHNKRINAVQKQLDLQIIQLEQNCQIMQLSQGSNQFSPQSQIDYSMLSPTSDKDWNINEHGNEKNSRQRGQSKTYNRKHLPMTSFDEKNFQDPVSMSPKEVKTVFDQQDYFSSKSVQKNRGNHTKINSQTMNTQAYSKGGPQSKNLQIDQFYPDTLLGKNGNPQQQVQNINQQERFIKKSLANSKAPISPMSYQEKKQGGFNSNVKFQTQKNSKIIQIKKKNIQFNDQRESRPDLNSRDDTFEFHNELKQQDRYSLRYGLENDIVAPPIVDYPYNKNLAGMRIDQPETDLMNETAGKGNKFSSIQIMQMAVEERDNDLNDISTNVMLANSNQVSPNLKERISQTGIQAKKNTSQRTSVVLPSGQHFLAENAPIYRKRLDTGFDLNIKNKKQLQVLSQSLNNPKNFPSKSPVNKHPNALRSSINNLIFTGMEPSLIRSDSKKIGINQSKASVSIIQNQHQETNSVLPQIQGQKESNEGVNQKKDGLLLNQPSIGSLQNHRVQSRFSNKQQRNDVTPNNELTFKMNKDSRKEEQKIIAKQKLRIMAADMDEPNVIGPIPQHNNSNFQANVGEMEFSKTQGSNEPFLCLSQEPQLAELDNFNQNQKKKQFANPLEIKSVNQARRKLSKPKKQTNNLFGQEGIMREVYTGTGARNSTVQTFQGYNTQYAMANSRNKLVEKQNTNNMTSIQRKEKMAHTMNMGRQITNNIHPQSSKFGTSPNQKDPLTEQQQSNPYINLQNEKTEAIKGVHTRGHMSFDINQSSQHKIDIMHVDSRVISKDGGEEPSAYGNHIHNQDSINQSSTSNNLNLEQQRRRSSMRTKLPPSQNTKASHQPLKRLRNNQTKVQPESEKVPPSGRGPYGQHNISSGKKPKQANQYGQTGNTYRYKSATQGSGASHRNTQEKSKHSNNVSLQKKESQRKLVVKNLIIQNSNLQNCNVYIGAADNNQDDIKITNKNPASENNEPENNYNNGSQGHYGQFMSAEQIKENENSPLIKHDKPTLSEFKITRIIGEGHQGKVVQAKHKNSGEIYALKIIPAKLIKEQKQIQHIYNEKIMLTQLRHEQKYFPKIYNTFSEKISLNNMSPTYPNLMPGTQQKSNSQIMSGNQQTQFLVFQMSLIEGINLFKFQKNFLCIKPEIVKYFAAQALNIIDFLQNENIIYRDIKPENFIVEYNSGNMKLVDFGFAKKLKNEQKNGLFQGRGRTFTKCGTPEYMAPEVIQQKELNNTQTRVSQSSFLQKQLGYSLECDIWSWGVMLCEMIGGYNPFTCTNIQGTFENILSLNINWPKNISKEVKNLLQSIFVVDPTLRASITDIKKNSFFKGLDWSDLGNSISLDAQKEIKTILNEIKDREDKEFQKEREQREKDQKEQRDKYITDLNTQQQNKKSQVNLSVQTKNLEVGGNKNYVSQPGIPINEMVDSPSDGISKFEEFNFDEEISPMKVFEPKSAGMKKNQMPFMFQNMATNAFNNDSERVNVSDFSLRKNLQAFKDF